MPPSARQYGDQARRRVALITNMCPPYRYPLFELLAREFETTFYFFSTGDEPYRGAAQHQPGNLAVRDLHRINVAGQPLSIGLNEELRREPYDAVIKCINGRLMLPYVYALAKRRGIPFVLWTGTWHHPRTISHRLTRGIVEGIYRGADAIVAYGDHVKDFLKSNSRIEPEKTYVSGQAIDPAPFRTVTPTFDSPAVILFIGQLEPHKGVRELISAFQALDDKNARLRMAGTGSLEQEVRAHAEADARIEILGHLMHRDLPAEFASARCLVLPAITTSLYRECWGLVVNEAMSSGIPVITSDAVGAAAGGLVRDGSNGFVFPEGDRGALIAAMQRMVGNGSLARSLGTQARMDVSKYNYPRMAGAFADAIEHAIAAKRGQASLRSHSR